MPEETLQRFQIKRLAILNEHGEVDSKLEPQLSEQQLKKMFEDMIRVREFDARSISLQRQGRMGPYASSLGQEAIHVGSAQAMAPTDWAVPSFREQGVFFSRGIKATTLFLFFMGTEEGNRLPRKTSTLPYSVPCATQILHAVGIGMAAKIKKDPIGVVAYFGDGATSEGDFHEAMNFAGVYQTSTVFLCQNNQWAISTPLSEQTASPTIAQKAIGYGLEGLQVDGNDIFAVYRSTQEALKKARLGKGPTLLECVTYRMEAHTTSDDPSRYRDEQALQPWLAKDPIDRFEKYLLNKGFLQKGERNRIQEKLAEELKKQAAEAEEICRRLSPDEMFTYMYTRMPEILRPQMEEVLHHAASLTQGGLAHGGSSQS